MIYTRVEFYVKEYYQGNPIVCKKIYVFDFATESEEVAVTKFIRQHCVRDTEGYYYPIDKVMYFKPLEVGHGL